MTYYQPGFSCFGRSNSCFNSPQGAIVFSAIIALLLVNVLEKTELEDAGNVLLTIGQMMITAGEFL